MSLFDLFSISSSGMAAQRARAELLVQNLANSETTRTPEGGPYRRKDVIFTSQPLDGSFSDVLNSQLGVPAEGVRIAGVTVDQREPERRYSPGHPDADQDGYVLFPRINPAEDMVDLMSATRTYQANVSAISAVKDMIQRSLDILK